MSQAIYTYEKAPIVELIAEVRWSLVELKAIQGAIDPFYDGARPHLVTNLKALGVQLAEPVVPPEIPIEMLPRQVVWRYRAQANSWPLYQYGPGVFTANITAPYPGWKVFSEFLAKGVEALEAAYKSAGGTIKLERLVLRYINAFTDEHGLQNDAALFARARLGIDLTVPETLSSFFGDSWSQRKTTSELTVPLISPVDAKVTVKIGEGKRNETPACIVDLNVSGSITDTSQVLPWFSQSHDSALSCFESLIGDQRESLLGSRRETK